jgi:Regulator of ribonuclease activity B
MMNEATDSVEKIRAHTERNFLLLQRLKQMGVLLDEPRSVELHFWAPGKTSAYHLGSALCEKGHIVRCIAPTDDPAIWNVESAIELSPNQVVDERFTTDLIKTAQAFGASYDGWGTSV